MKEKLCPFNGFNPCIGERCAMYLEEATIVSKQDSASMDIKMDEQTLCCSLRLIGINSFYEIGVNIAKMQMANG